MGLSEKIDVSSDDPEIVAAGEAHLHRCLEFLGDAVGTHLVGVIYSAMRKYMAPATQTNRQHSIDAIGRLSTRAAELDIRIAIEVVNRYESNLLNTARQAVRYIEDAAAENLLVHLDTYHMNIEEPDMFARDTEPRVCGRGRAGGPDLGGAPSRERRHCAGSKHQTVARSLP
ncbi:MAG: TIM barrel protein [Actinophytocola sp.]|nr:TIM barrel protein [Actinophytocola sp.]